GGFLIIPALVILARMPMKLAVGTSLFIIAAKSLLGFIGDLQGGEVIDWSLLSLFSSLSIIGIFLGIYLSRKIDGSKLKTGFGWFVLIMGVYILMKELIFNAS
ncbi:MAG: TSUP family transporter, partial [Weeksellaceae bacterium]